MDNTSIISKPASKNKKPDKAFIEFIKSKAKQKYPEIPDHDIRMHE
ncbi:MAG: hypothetical protein KAS78_06255 [Candidatus Pacebacteria bacterium]|nr:hypothetical protein [Candidatus Paceibacterota bacterium]